VKNTVDSDIRKHELLAKVGLLFIVRGCQWKKQREAVLFAKGGWSNGPRSLISKHYYSAEIYESTIMNSIFDDEFFGLICCNIITPPEVKADFLKLNVGTIFTRITVTEDMLETEMKKVYLF